MPRDRVQLLVERVHFLAQLVQVVRDGLLFSELVLERGLLPALLLNGVRRSAKLQTRSARTGP